MAGTKTVCACGGTFEKRTDEIGTSGNKQVCSGCGTLQETCSGCGEPADKWAVAGSVCEGCGPGCIDGSVNIYLSDSQQSQLLSWAEGRGLLPV